MKALRGRERERAALYKSLRAVDLQPALVVVSGPRRVGKTLLVRHVLEELAPSTIPLYFEATQAGPVAQLRRFHDVLRAVVELPPGPAPESWEQALQLAAYAAGDRGLVVVIDEATYLMDADPSFASQVQVVWDDISTRTDPPKIGIVLTGSAVGLIEDAMSHKGALFQRPTFALRLNPFSAAEAHSFTGRPDEVKLFEAYAACGGYPLHLDAWDFDETTSANMARLAGSPGGLLLEDGNLTLAGLSEGHRRVLIAVGQGRTRMAEIANEVGGRAERPVEGLVRAGMISRILPARAPLKARPQHRVEDAYLRFWIRLLANHVQQVEGGQGVAVLRSVEELWNEHLGWCFEQAAREHAVRLVGNGQLPDGTIIEEWWTSTGQQAQVDVLGTLDHRTVVIGEAQWQSRPLGRSDVDELATKIGIVPSAAPNLILALWGRGGVRADVQVGNVKGYGPTEVLTD